MGSLAEVYLSAYGWQLYGVLYLIFWVLKIMLYPMVRLAFDAYIEYVSQPGDVSAPLRSVMVRLMVMLAVFISAAVPMVPYEVAAARIEMPGCGVKPQNSEAKAALTSRFGGNAYVPLFPYLAMMVASGVNSAALQTLPCVGDMLKANQMANNIALPDTDEGRAVFNEYQAFSKQCYIPAVGMMDPNGSFSRNVPARVEVINQLRVKYHPTRKETSYGASEHGPSSVVSVLDVKQGVDYIGSDYLNKVIYTDEACNNFTPTEAGSGLSASVLGNEWKDMCNAITNMNVITPYGEGQSKGTSEYQTSTGVQNIRCGDWWNGNNGLQNRLSRMSFESHMMKFAKSVTGNNEVTTDALTELTIDPYNLDNSNAQGKKNYLDGLYQQISEDQKEKFVFLLREAGEHQGSQLLSGMQSATLGTLGTISLVTSMGGSAADLSSAVMTAMIAKAAISLAHPILLMMIYALWLVFLIIGEFRGTVLVKGLLMIFVIKFCTTVFAIADRLSNELLALMVPDLGKGGWGIISQLPDAGIVMMVGTFTYFAVPGIMMYLIATAGGPDATRLTSSASGMSQKTAELGGGATRPWITGVTKNVGKGINSLSSTKNTGLNASSNSNTKVNPFL